MALAMSTGCLGLDRSTSWAGQSWWQALPLAHRLWQLALSASVFFRGQRTSRQPDWLMEDGLLGKNECDSGYFRTTKSTTTPSLRTSGGSSKQPGNFVAGVHGDLRAGYEQFRNDQAHLAGGLRAIPRLESPVQRRILSHWPRELVERVPSKLAEARGELSETIDQVCFAQFLIFRQGERLKAYAQPRCAVDRRHALLRVARFQRRRSNPEIFLLTSGAGRDSSPACLPITSARTDSYGAIPFTTGMNFVALVIAGVSTGCGRCCLTSTWFGWIISALSRRPGTCQWERPTQARAMGTRTRVRFLYGDEKGMGALPFIAEDLGLITADVVALRDAHSIPGTRVLQFGLTVIRRIRICRTTTVRIPWLTPAA